MNKYPKIGKTESRKDTWLYVKFYLILAFLVVLAVCFVVWIISSLSSIYNEGLDTCMSKGYSKEYCSMMLN